MILSVFIFRRIVFDCNKTIRAPKGGLYIVSYNKFYGCTNILDDVVNSFGIECLRSYKVQESKGSLEGVGIWKSGHIDCLGHKQSYRGIRTRYSFI